ncbi:MAG TPA: selenocysteine-specific translation elongation factor [Bacteroidales bacterium]|nr:selenocysteine-specific translation elongation factor [Bacteroidales bacterium]
MSKHVIMGTAGHVDHGKTALIRMLTGIDCDTHKEEKERGITINLGFAHLELDDDFSIGIVDVPGHKDFVKTMVAGAYGIDFVLLVIAADSGIMPQTKEHFNILKMLGIRYGLVALNKCDLVDNETVELARLEITEFLEGSPLEHAPVVPVSSITGQGIDLLKEEIKKIAAAIPEKKLSSVFRMYIDRIFNIRGIGIVVTGSVLGGKINVGRELYLMPGNFDALKIKNIERHGQPVDSVMSGDRAAINLSGLKYEDFQRGMLLADKPLQEISMMDALIEFFPGIQRIEIWSQMIFHTGTFSSVARIHLLNKDELSGGDSAIAQIHLKKPAILLNNDRFILRNSSSDLTIGGGQIIDNHPLHHKRRTEKLRFSLEKLTNAITDHEDQAALILLEIEKANKPVTPLQIAETLGKQLHEIEKTIQVENFPAHHYFFENKLFLASETYVNHLKNKIILTLKDWHEQNPLKETGPEAKELAGKIKLQQGFELFVLQKTLDEMLAAKELKKTGSTFSLKEHKVKLDRKMHEQITWLEETIQSANIQRTSINEIEASAKLNEIRRGQLIMYLQYLTANGKIYFNGEEAIHASVVNGIRNKLLNKLVETPRGINEKEFRMLVDGTKKAIQALIHIFTQEGIIEKQTFYLYITEKGREYLTNK